MEEIKSKDNKLIKLIRSLATRKAREEHHLFLLEGPKVIQEAFETDAVVKALCIREDLLESASSGELTGKGSWLKELLLIAEERNREGENVIRLVAVDKEIFRGLTETENSQGVLALLEMMAEKQREEQWNGIIKGAFTLLALDEIKDPGNMGTIIRTAEAFGIDGILIGNCGSGSALELELESAGAAIATAGPAPAKPSPQPLITQDKENRGLASCP